jgi:hypothetical protein
MIFSKNLAEKFYAARTNAIIAHCINDASIDAMAETQKLAIGCDFNPNY